MAKILEQFQESMVFTVTYTQIIFYLCDLSIVAY